MDRKIPENVLRKEKIRHWLKIGGTGIVVLAGIWWTSSFFQSRVHAKDLVFSTVETGNLEVSINASGKVVPAFEEIITSPINTRIVEVYRHAGDSVDAGTPLLKLDLQSAETDYQKLLDEGQMKRYQMEQLRLNNQTYLSNLKMQVKVSEMKLNRMAAELRNERYLDSLGSGTTDKVRQAELAYKTGKLELEQLQQQYQNECDVKDAELKIKQLELNMFNKGLADTKRTLDDAQIRSPRKATLTYINDQIGDNIVQGSQVAIISDLSHFKVNCEIGDAYANKVANGGKAVIRIANQKLEGFIANVTPLSKNGVISFTVQLRDAGNKVLRPGLRTDVYVMQDIRANTMMIRNGSYYTGPGNYVLFVKTADDKLEKRNVQLGECNYEQVEVINGLRPGEQVVISNMDDYKKHNQLTLTD
ncbi:HlyD family efflux transporter periplasmic adaptor subunit [uncultured Bacteroides sp.]|uniref:efflux RND transporter periplasmic adaptor subunit n=1 Tax=uncultured Bacteroides sp. TaxID=162156 RepID=UPI002631542E|nr:HlyD family efflux transporter periplasmic adaptor subunit [uncultured Bacteroides sp.]